VHSKQIQLQHNYTYTINMIKAVPSYSVNICINSCREVKIDNIFNSWKSTTNRKLIHWFAVNNWILTCMVMHRIILTSKRVNEVSMKGSLKFESWNKP